MRRLALVLSCVLLVADRPAGPFDSAGSLLAQSEQTARVIAIGDIHGSIEGLSRILKATGLIDAGNKWVGGKAALMQTGDYMDRGADVRAVLDLLMALEPQAKEAGGRAFALLGNHELMNLLGETRDANPPIYAKFADAQSESRRQKGWKDYSALGAAKTAKGETVPDVYRQTREAWMEAHPPGYLEYRDALAPKGKYGAWLRGKPMVTNFSGSIFMHAGIPPATAPAKIDDLNDKLKDEVRRMDRFVQRLVDRKLALPFFTLQEVVQVAVAEVTTVNTLLTTAKETGKELDRALLDLPLLTDAQEILKVDKWLSLDPEASLWYRGLSTEPDDEAGGPFLPLLTRYGAQRFVTGHTPTADRRIWVRFGGRAVLIDTGMNTAFYKGRASALEMDGEKLTAIYEDGRVPLWPRPAP